MAAVIYLDTHLVVWLFAGRLDLIPKAVAAQIDEHDLLVSPMVELELEYLNEIGRLSESASTVMSALSAAIGLKTCELSFSAIISRALEEKWTRDPFDRIIVAQARVGKASLLTRDRTIQQHFDGAIWD